jgi:hypothetical protein
MVSSPPKNSLLESNIREGREEEHTSEMQKLGRIALKG